MREAMGSSALLYIVIIIVSAVMLLFVSIISYAKAYGAKNKIISAIETFEGYDAAKTEIDTHLGKIGYTISTKDFCSVSRVQKHLRDMGLNPDEVKNLNTSNASKYSYCIYKVDRKTPSGKSDGEYYLVVTFVNFNIPVIGGNLAFPVYGQTKLVNRTYEF